jgi:zinc protease
MVKLKNLVVVLIIFSGFLMAQDNKVFPYETVTGELDNGMKVILIPMESPGLVSYYSVVRTGSRDEWEPGKSGFAHFFEHMMFRGTEKYPGPVYDSIVTSLGADANAYTSDDLTVYHLNFASSDLEKIMELESDRFRNLSYSEEQFKTESGAIYGEFRKGKTNPFFVAIEKLRDISYEKHTYKHTTIGFEEDIKNMPNIYDYSLSFYDRYYRPENVVILIVGDIDPDAVMEKVKEYYSEWKPGYVEPQITQEPPQTQPRKAEVSYDGKTLPILIFGYKTNAFDATDKIYLASSLLSDLAFGEISDIYKKLVLNEQKIQFVSASEGANRDPGLFLIYSMIKDEKDIDYVRTEILNTLEKFKTTPVDEQKLNDLKMRQKYSFLMRLDNNKSVAGALPYYITYTGGIEVIDEMYNNMDEITPEDIMHAANFIFQTEKRNEVLLKGKSE